MADLPDEVHDDTLEASVTHYNSTFRHRYRLPEVTLGMLDDLPELAEAFDNLAVVRANGITDPGCAVIAQAVVPMVPRYVIGHLDEMGEVGLFPPTLAEVTAYLGRHVLLANPLGGLDNWESVSRWFKEVASDDARRAELASLASEERPDQAAIERDRFDANARGEHAISLLPDEGFSYKRALEVHFIYGVGAEIETLRTWKKKFRAELGSTKRGAPRRKR